MTHQINIYEIHRHTHKDNPVCEPSGNLYKGYTDRVINWNTFLLEWNPDRLLVPLEFSQIHYC